MMRFVVILWLMLAVTLKCAVKWGWNKKFEFCEDKWNVFVQEKNKSEERCGNLSLTNGCIEEKNYLLERFRMFSEICPLEGNLYILHLPLHTYFHIKVYCWRRFNLQKPKVEKGILVFFYISIAYAKLQTYVHW